MYKFACKIWACFIPIRSVTTPGGMLYICMVPVNVKVVMPRGYEDVGEGGKVGKLDGGMDGKGVGGGKV